MNKKFLPNAENIKKHINKTSKMCKMVMCLVAIVIFCISYALILPTIAKDQEAHCGIENHIHEESCYEKQLVCEANNVIEEGEPHQHTDVCYQSALICKKEEHTHESSCYIDQTEESTNTNNVNLVNATATANGEGENDTTEGTQEEGNITVDAPAGDVTKNLEPQAAPQGMDPITPTASTDPIDVSTYIKTAKLFYKTDDMTDWVNVAGVEDIPGKATFKLEIGYKDVKIVDLKNADYKMKYTLPDIFRDAVADGDIVSGKDTVGNITVNEQDITLNFDSTWIEKQEEENQTVINGDFYVTAKLNISVAPGNGGTQTYMFGEVKITIDFEDDLYVKNVDINLEKTVEDKIEETNDGCFLNYTVTVRAGQDEVRDVVVKDIFEKNMTSKYIEEYIVSEDDKQYVEIEKTPGDYPGTLIWTVGTIEANQTRYLTYKVKLKEDYKNLCLSQDNIKDENHVNTKLVNNAQVYVNERERDTASATFVPKSEGKVWKHTGKFKSNKNGGGTITYMVRVEAPETNNITLDNVTIKDALDGSFKDGYVTDNKYRKYIKYVEDSFELYNGSCDKEEKIESLTKSEQQGTFKFPETEGKHNTSFEYTIGSMQPGDKKTLIYKIEIEPGVYVEAGNNDIKITNRAYLYAGGSDEFEKGQLNQSTTDAIISKKCGLERLQVRRQKTI